MINSDLHIDVVIVGLGKTGLSCVRYLAGKNLALAVTDSRIEPPELTEFKNEFEKIPVYLGEINIDLLLSAEQIILSPGVSLETDEIKQAIDAGIPVYGDIELFCQQASAPIIAISGSNGKSTVTSLVAEMARQA
ncbi:MAG: UDP-N-acetylmuramoyl-L-alanine--D-glutamate ligase, partial [Proteobacteria bacterium]|nr:UDP-N-acetylmuramoyl-L-alanine--D-glutamate ligase [Pseudomonadota bacterium]